MFGLKAKVEVVATPPPDETVDVSVSFSADPYDHANATATVTFTKDGTAAGSWTLHRQGANSTQYVGDALDAPTLDIGPVTGPVLQPGQTDDRVAIVNAPTVGLDSDSIALHETGANTGVFTGRKVTTEEDRPDLRGYDLFAGAKSNVTTTGSGDLKRYVYELDGPEGLLTKIDLIKIGDRSLPLAHSTLHDAILTYKSADLSDRRC